MRERSEEKREKGRSYHQPKQGPVFLFEFEKSLLFEPSVVLLTRLLSLAFSE